MFALVLKFSRFLLMWCPLAVLNSDADACAYAGVSSAIIALTACPDAGTDLLNWAPWAPSSVALFSTHRVTPGPFSSLFSLLSSVKVSHSYLTEESQPDFFPSGDRRHGWRRSFPVIRSGRAKRSIKTVHDVVSAAKDGPGRLRDLQTAISRPSRPPQNHQNKPTHRDVYRNYQGTSRQCRPDQGKHRRPPHGPQRRSPAASGKG